MKKLLATIISLIILNSLVYSQYDYGLDVCEKDAKIDGKLVLGNSDDKNIFIGTNAGQSITYNNPLLGSGSVNTFVGFNAGKSTTSGGANTFLGCFSGELNTQGQANTFIGYWSGTNNTQGEYNVFMGRSAGYSNQSGKENTFLGAFSGHGNTTGERNTYLGYSSGSSNSLSNDNTTVGYLAGQNNTAFGNTLIGSWTGNNITSGWNNTLLGYTAHVGNSSAGNVVLGSRAGNNNLGSFNILIGYDAGANETGSNKLYIENAGLDEPDNLTPLIYGEFDNDKIQINGSLHISEYTRFIPGIAPTSPEKGTIYYDSSDDKVKVWTGSTWENLFFTSSTQTETSFKENTDSPCNTFCVETLNTSMQKQKELTKENIELKERLSSVETQLKEMRTMVNLLAEQSQVKTKSVLLNQSAKLEQNVPNPFKGTTKIQYLVPPNSHLARIKIYDITGQIVKSIDIENFGRGEIEVQVDKLSKGIYHYSLEIDGKIIDTKKMSSIK